MSVTERNLQGRLDNTDNTVSVTEVAQFSYQSFLLKKKDNVRVRNLYLANEISNFLDKLDISDISD